MGDFDKYLKHFPAGIKVNIGIPVPGGTVFHDWAIIHNIDEDLVEIQLSRDILPAGVRLNIGTILDLRAGKDESAHSCRAIIVSEGYQRSVLLRLIGEIVTDELRDFYRIDAFLPIRYFLTSETNETKLKKFCLEKRIARIEADKERREKEKKPWERLRLRREEEIPEEELSEESAGEDSGEGIDENSIEADEDNRWDDIIPIAANISGGGVRMLIHHQFRLDELVTLEIFLPSEPQSKVVDAVGKVVSVTENRAAEKQMHRESYNTGIQFLYIDERDQDAIVSYISNVQLKRIRLLREKYLGMGIDTPPPPMTDSDIARLALTRTILAVVVIAILGAILLYFKGYAENRPKNEIELIFEKGFMEYLQKIGRQ